MDKIRIIIADDDRTFCNLVSDLLRREGYDTISVCSVEECTKALISEQVHILMLDMCFPALRDGFDMLALAKKDFPKVVVLMISGEGNIPDAVAAIKNGAMDFIEKPIAPAHLLLRLKAVVTLIEMEDRIKLLSSAAIGMIGVSKAMQKVFDEIIRAAQYDLPLLITGETGVGKELAALAVHRLSRAKNKELVIINCAAIPRELFEAELFGYEQGSFTGANKAHKGYFEYANGAAVFLDEIGELPLDVQSKLLRVLSEGEIQKLGGRIQKVNLRVFSASNRNLMDLIKGNGFREDLFYRLNTLNIHIPPLRERKEDILPLALHFINQVCAENSLAPKQLSPQAQVWLLEQDWKGNIRELKNAIYRGVVFAEGELIQVANLQTNDYCTDSVCGEDITNLRFALRCYERRHILNSLMAHDNNISQTANTLGMDKSNLCKRIKALDIKIKEGKNS